MRSTPRANNLEPNKRILAEWSADGAPTDIDWVFTARSDGTTFVSITNSGFGGSPQEIANDVLLNLVPDRFPDGPPKA